MARAFGVPFQVAFCVVGLLIAMLAAGVLNWLRKRHALRISVRRRGPLARLGTRAKQSKQERVADREKDGMAGAVREQPTRSMA